MCFDILVVYESCECWVLLLKIVANQAGKQSSKLPPLSRWRWFGGLLPDMIRGCFLLSCLCFLTFHMKSFGLHAPDLPCAREGGFEAVCSMQNAEKTKGSLSHISLEFFSCFQPLSHPRFARLTAPLGNGSQCTLSFLLYMRTVYVGFFC